MMLDHVSRISGKRDLDGDEWIVSECSQGIEITRYPAPGVCVLFCPEAPRDFGNYMRKCASGGQSLANAELGMGLSVPVQKIKFSINNLPVYVS